MRNGAMVTGLDGVLAALDGLTVAERDVVLEAARIADQRPTIAGPTTNGEAKRLVEVWRRLRDEREIAIAITSGVPRSMRFSCLICGERFDVSCDEEDRAIEWRLAHGRLGHEKERAHEG